MTEQTQQQPFWHRLNLPAPGTHIDRDAYRALPSVPFHMEWHAGTVIYPNWNEISMSPSPSSQHQRLVVRLLQVLAGLIPDGDLLTAPMDLYLSGRIVQPDVFWVAPGTACIDRGTFYEGPPALIVEVLSPTNTANDRVTKFDLYEQNGVSEYWMANPAERYLEVYTLSDSTYQRLGAFRGQTFTSPALSAPIDTAHLLK